MTFVFTPWYFVMALLLAGIVACIVVFIKMDKKDRELIGQFVKESQEAPKASEVKDEPKVEEKVETKETTDNN
ncbi:MAG: hypothetical protein E7351_00895 [Clostridiales bacterium]|nr:hypothetical protein [Clostridiales bacterium]